MKEYQIIYADPPWTYKVWSMEGNKRSACQHYSTMSKEELQKLPGVGRKTANVIASVVYNLPALPVDTHVFRVSARLGLTTDAKNPLQTEKQLLKYIPEEKIPIAHHWLILHGRYTCTSRSPKCPECGLRPYCKYFQTVVKKQMMAAF